MIIMIISTEKGIIAVSRAAAGTMVSKRVENAGYRELIVQESF